MLSREYNEQELSDELKKKLAGLEEYIRGLGSLAVGFPVELILHCCS